MRKLLFVSAFVLVGALLAWSVAAQDCDYVNFKWDTKTFGVIDPPHGDFDFCGQVTRLLGNLNGRFEWCFYFADQSPTSSSIYGDSYTQVGTARYFELIETSDGDIQMIEWTWWDGDFGTETGMAKVVGGTGDYEGASGILFVDVPPFPLGGHVFQYEGYICTP